MKTLNGTNRVNSVWLFACVMVCAIVVLPVGLAYAGQPDFEAVGTRLIEAVEEGELSPEQAVAMMGELARASFSARLKGALGSREERERERERAESLEGHFRELGLEGERFDKVHEYLKQSGLSDRQIELTLGGMLRIVHVMREEGEDIELNERIMNYLKEKAELDDGQIALVYKLSQQIARLQDEGEDERIAAYRTIELRIRRAVETGRLSREEAEEKLIEIRTRMFEKNEEREDREEDREEVREEDRGEHHEEVREEVREEDYAVEVWFQKVGERLKAAVKKGDISEEEAWNTWYEIKEKGFIPRLKAAVESGGMTREKAEAIWRDIEKAEAGERLKAAVRKGEISEEEAKAKWQVITKEKKEPGTWIKTHFNKLGLNEEKLAGIREHLKKGGLTDEQVNKALRGMLRVVYERKAEGEKYKMNPQLREYFKNEVGLTDEQIDKVQQFANRVVNGMRPMPGKREE